MTQLLKRPFHWIRLRLVIYIYGVLLLIQTSCLAQPEQANNWKIFSLGVPSLQINLPGEVTPMETSIPWDLINHIQRFDTYRFYHAEGKVVAIFKFAQYNAPIEQSSSALIETEINNVMQSIKAEQVVHDENEYMLNKIPGQKSTGSFMLNNQKWNFKDILLRNDSSMWQVWIAAEGSNPGYGKTMNKVVKGIKF